MLVVISVRTLKERKKKRKKILNQVQRDLSVNYFITIAILTFTSPIVIYVPTRDLLAVETMVLLFCGYQNLNTERIVYKQWISLHTLHSLVAFLVKILQ